MTFLQVVSYLSFSTFLAMFKLNTNMLKRYVDALAQFDEVNHFNSSVSGYLRDVSTVLELYKASHTKILPNERILEKIEFWSSCYLKEGLSADVIRRPQLDSVSEEVNAQSLFASKILFG